MTIPNFKSIDDYQEFVKLFRKRWEVKLELLNLVREDMFPGCHGWSSLPPSSLETINDITQSLLYDVEYTFCQEYPEYDKDRDDVFIPRRSFKEDVTEALLEANQKFWHKDVEDVTEALLEANKDVPQ